MHNLKFIRENTDIFKKKISDRNVNVDIDKLIKLDQENRQLIQNKEKLEQEKKIISKTKDKTKFDKSKKIIRINSQLSSSQWTNAIFFCIFFGSKWPTVQSRLCLLRPNSAKIVIL